MIHHACLDKKVQAPLNSEGNAFSYKAPKLWNNIPVSICDSDSPCLGPAFC